MRDHTKLRAFELADNLAVLVYKHTAIFPKEEMFGLTSQLRRAAVSLIPLQPGPKPKSSERTEGLKRRSPSNNQLIKYLE